MIAGLLVLMWPACHPFFPAQPPLPIRSPADGANAQACPVHTGWYGLVTSDDRNLIYNRSDGQFCVQKFLF